MAGKGRKASSQTNGSTQHVKNELKGNKVEVAATHTPSAANLLNLVICVGGIYASFLTWGFLQERITTSTYQHGLGVEKFKFPVFMNTIQSTLAALLGYLYTIYRRRSTGAELPIIPSQAILGPLLLVAITSSLSSPFGYASLQYVDYITFILAKSCKLLPVMLLHVVLYQRRYPFQKYAVVALVTAGVAVFTLHEGGGSKKKKGSETGNSVYGLVLLSINLLFDGLTNATQDNIHAKFKAYTGPQMMTALNTLSTLLTSAYLLASPYLAQTQLGDYVGISLSKNAGELSGALAFIQRHPEVGWDILGFAICGAVGQVFIFQTLSIFGSLLLVTVTVTRKMLTMIISIFWFGHALTMMQWVGIGLVFGGIGIEAELNKREKAAKEAAKRKQT